MRATFLGCLALLGSPALSKEPASLAFRIDEGRNLNSFLRDGPVAAHLLLRQGHEPRLLVAFPAGNSGVGLWFADTEKAATWTLAASPKAVSEHDAKQRPLHGIEFAVEVTARELKPRAAVLSSVRILRDYELQHTAPAEVMVAPRFASGTLVWARDRLDGAAGYRLTIEAAGGTRLTKDRFTAAPDEPLRLKVRAMTGEAPLRPLDALLTANARDDSRARHALQFLSYEDKFLAGSWRFNTYFGRDTMISALLLAPVLEPAAMEGAIGSVLDRLAPNGEVAHEEDIGEFAVWRNAREGRGRVDVPIYDYGMVDDDFLLAPLVARWLSDARMHEDGRAANFLRRDRGRLLVRHLLWVVDRASAFAEDPRAGNLIAIKPGRNTGNWRDSEQGLALGRYAYDINAALVPAALEATANLADSGLLEPYLDATSRQALSRAKSVARVWAARAPVFFALSVPGERARRELEAYAAEQGLATSVPDAGSSGTLRFNAISLDADGKPIPVMHSDEGFRLLLTEPSAAELDDLILTILRPFPAGLVTDAGVVVANPAQANPSIEREFSRNAYHGTVVWSWQQALLAAGLDRQLRRADLTAATRARLLRARAIVWKAIDSSRALRTSELWSWSYSNGRFQIEPFGGRGADADESNAAQLWSTVFLGLTPASR